MCKTSVDIGKFRKGTGDNCSRPRPTRHTHFEHQPSPAHQPASEADRIHTEHLLLRQLNGHLQSLLQAGCNVVQRLQYLEPCNIP